MAEIIAKHSRKNQALRETERKMEKWGGEEDGNRKGGCNKCTHTGIGQAAGGRPKRVDLHPAPG